MKKLMHATKNSLPENQRVELCAILNKTLASTTDLYVQCKQAHWNIKGMSFIGLHLLLDKIAEEVEEQVDVVAERVTSLGGTALGTIQETVKNTQLREYPVDIFDEKDHIAHLTHNIAILSELARTDIEKSEEYGDMATNDLYIDLVRMLEKNLWFLEAHVQK
ncbi:MAG: DNA starvation/stationary phase protection protein Dps [Candidatus Babeliales bacterium]